MLRVAFILVVFTSGCNACAYRHLFHAVCPQGDGIEPESTTSRNFAMNSKNLTGSVHINTAHVVHVTDHRFLSVSIDAFVIRWRWGAFDFSSTKLKNLAKALAPAVLRIGGTDADFLIFDEATSTRGRRDGESSKEPDYRTNFTMTATDWDKINTFAAEVGWDILFDLNMLLRNQTSWDITNARTLMEYTRKKDYKIAGWELGNEPNNIKHHSNISISAEQLAQDYISLRKLLDTQGFDNSFLVGPSITRPKFDKIEDQLGDDSIQYLQSFLRNSGDANDITTFHSYYVNVKDVSLDNFTDYHLMNVLRKQIVKVQQIIQRYRPSLPTCWLGETDGVSGGGAPDMSDSYAAGFLWLDKLGLSAKYGVDVVIRQSFYGKYYGLLTNDTLHPTPCYWLSLLYKQLVGQVVLDVNITIPDHQINNGLDKSPTHVRIYAHCKRERADSSESGGNITIFILNLQKRKHLSLTLTGCLVQSTVYQYLLQPFGNDTITAKNVSLNGKELTLTESGNVPDLTGRKLNPGELLSLPPLSYGFFVIEANSTACSRVNYLTDLVKHN